MTSDNNEQTEILRGIWNEMKALNGRIGETNARLDQTNARLEAVRVELKGEISELRTELRTNVSGLRNEMHQGFEMLGRRIDNLLLGQHGDEHRDLRERVERLERKVGIGR